MPNYDYKCEGCGYQFEIFQKMVEEPLTICPKCGEEIRRIITGGTGIIFKGAGFYCNDYAKKGCSKKECEAKEKEKSRSVEDIQKGKYPD